MFPSRGHGPLFDFLSWPKFWVPEYAGSVRQLLKVFFTEHATTEAALANLEAARDWARAQIDEHIAVGRAYLEGAGTFQERLAVNVITGTFLARFALLVEQWAEWALGVVASWPEDPRQASPDVRSLEGVVRELETIRSVAGGS
jgi:hypothetical protein